ncbi:unnamed protein product [Paramecium pentaurelia]|uniref:Uncharacterized protein n=1 Tax=Paramecium pentaurelia TaxID=43138 RepID=A0A8S1WDX1_9CILI|nr:unnamed protein product [Paramecium pentaurelia]
MIKVDSIKRIIKNISKKISLLNANAKASDMYDQVNDLIYKYNVQNVEIKPLLETFSLTNNTDSKITMIANSDTRQRYRLILTELRNIREYKRNPEKFIYMVMRRWTIYFDPYKILGLNQRRTNDIQELPNDTISHLSLLLPSLFVKWIIQYQQQ